jgi:hypothetical protein
MKKHGVGTATRRFEVTDFAEAKWICPHDSCIATIVKSV